MKSYAGLPRVLFNPSTKQVTPQADTSAPLVSSGGALNWTAQVDLAGFAAETGIQGFFCPTRLTPVVDPSPAGAAALAAVTVSGDATTATFSTPAAAAGSYSLNLNVRSISQPTTFPFAFPSASRLV